MLGRIPALLGLLGVAGCHLLLGPPLEQGGAGGTGGGGSGGGGAGGIAGGGSGGACPPLPPVGTPCEAGLQADPDNCCHPGRSCLGGTCTQGTCSSVPLVTGSNASTDARAIAFAAGRVVWATGCANRLASVAVDGTGFQLLPGGSSCTPNVAARGSRAYWTEWDGPRLWNTAVDGTEPTAVLMAAFPDPLATADFGRLVVDDFQVYFLSGTPPGVWYVPVVAQSATPKPVAAAASFGLGVEPVAGTYGVAVDEAFLYWGDHDPNGPPGSLRRKPLASLDGGASVLFVNTERPKTLAVDATHVYWTTWDGFVKRAPKGGIGGAEPLAASQPAPESIYVDERHVYWTNFTMGGDVRRVPKGGGTEEVVAGNQSFPYGITGDCAAVYWTNQADFSEGEVRRAAK